MLRMYYGAWYMEPDTWQRRHGRQVETRGGAEREDNTKVSRRESDFIVPNLFIFFLNFTGETPGRASWGSGHDGLPAAGVPASGHQGLCIIP